MEDRVTRLEEKVDHLQSDMTEMKGDIKRLDAGLSALRVETKDSISELRVEMKDSIGALRVETRDSHARLELKMEKLFSSVRHWALITYTGFAGALLFALARGLKWL